MERLFQKGGERERGMEREREKERERKEREKGSNCQTKTREASSLHGLNVHEMFVRAFTFRACSQNNSLGSESELFDYTFGIASEI